MDLIEGIKSRRSIREFKKEAVPREILTAIFTIASWAPNHRQKEPWKLHVYEKQKVNKLAEKMIASYTRMDYIKDIPEEKETIENIKNFITAIPHHVMVFFEKHEEERIYEEDFAAVCAFIQNAQLAAWEYGVGMLWTTSPYLYDPVFLEEIGLDPEKYKAVAVLQTGYPEKIPERKQREKMDNKIKWFDKEEVKK